MKKIIKEKYEKIDNILKSSEEFKGVYIDCILYKDEDTYTIVTDDFEKAYAFYGNDDYEEVTNWIFKYDYVLFDKLEEYEIGYMSEELIEKVHFSMSELPLGDMDRFDRGIDKFIKYIEESEE